MEKKSVYREIAKSSVNPIPTPTGAGSLSAEGGALALSLEEGKTKEPKVSKKAYK